MPAPGTKQPAHAKGPGGAISLGTQRAARVKAETEAKAARIRPAFITHYKRSRTVALPMRRLIERADEVREGLLLALEGEGPNRRPLSYQRRLLVEDYVQNVVIREASWVRFLQASDPEAARLALASTAQMRSTLELLGLDPIQHEIDGASFTPERVTRRPALVPDPEADTEEAEIVAPAPEADTMEPSEALPEIVAESAPPEAQHALSDTEQPTEQPPEPGTDADAADATPVPQQPQPAPRPMPRGLASGTQLSRLGLVDLHEAQLAERHRHAGERSDA